jgi:hypothetical protein
VSHTQRTSVPPRSSPDVYMWRLGQCQTLRYQAALRRLLLGNLSHGSSNGRSAGDSWPASNPRAGPTRPLRGVQPRKSCFIRHLPKQAKMKAARPRFRATRTFARLTAPIRSPHAHGSVTEGLSTKSIAHCLLAERRSRPKLSKSVSDRAFRTSRRVRRSGTALFDGNLVPISTPTRRGSTRPQAWFHSILRSRRGVAISVPAREATASRRRTARRVVRSSRRRVVPHR